MSEYESKSFWEIFEKVFVVLVVSILILFFFGLVLIPCLMDRNEISSSNVCINNLRQIDAAANQFALEHHLTNGDAINYPSDVAPYIKVFSSDAPPGHWVVAKSPLKCPSGGVYSIKKVGDFPICSLAATVAPEHALQ